jgi:predicted secreted Zn-dependent protease
MKNISQLVRLFVAGTVCIVALAFTTPLHAEVFQYFDDEGTLIITDNPFGLKRPKAAQPLKTYKPKKDQQVNLNLLGDVHYDYYPVFGRSFGEVIDSVQANGPYDSGDNRRYAGQTRWATGWSYSFDSSYKQDGGHLRAAVTIRDIQFRSDIVVLLPMLSPDSELGHHDLQQWQGFMARLLEHEHDHVRIVRESFSRDEAAKKVLSIREVVVRAEPGVDPDSLVQQAVETETARIGHELVRTVKAKNDEYDRLTEHGLRPEMKPVFFGSGY